MSVDPAMPTSVPPVTPSSPAEADLDPDALDADDREEEKRKEQANQRPQNGDEPPFEEVPPADEPTPLSDDLR